MERNVIPRIKLLRTQQGYSLQGLAEVTGLTKSYLSKLERGVCTPSIAAALRIARALGVDTQALFGETATNPDIAVIRHHARMSVERPAGLQGTHRAPREPRRRSEDRRAEAVCQRLPELRPGLHRHEAALCA